MSFLRNLRKHTISSILFWKYECYIYTYTKKMIKLCCDKHFICIECWDQLCKTYCASYKPGEKRGPPKCPFCRQSIW
jgi:hypothetical protein